LSCTPAQAAVDRGLLRSGKRTQYDRADMAKVLDVASQVAAGLQHLHARHIVHGGARPLPPHALHALAGCCPVAAHMITDHGAIF
jgi:hypothetical protein